MLELTQNESNLLLWTKGHYADSRAESFWPQLEIFYKEYYWMDELDIEGAYHMVRELWKKILDAMPNKDRFLERYEEDTLPSKACWFWGGPNFGKWYNPDTHKFDNESLLKARIAVMVSTIGATEVRFYKYLPAQEVGELKLKNKE